jgi:hypothetical protein
MDVGHGYVDECKDAVRISCNINTYLVSACFARHLLSKDEDIECPGAG